MPRHSLPRAPTALFDFAGQIVDALREKPVPSGLNLKIALELLTKLNSAMDAYLAYLAVREGAKYSTTARGFLREAARTWHHKERLLRQWVRIIAAHDVLADVACRPAL